MGLGLKKRYQVARVGLRYFARWLGKPLPRSLPERDLPVAHVISLPHRQDRRLRLKQEFLRVGARFETFTGIAHSFPTLGCAISHRNLLRSLPMDEPVWICEDDLVFSIDSGELNSIIRSFLVNEALDVLCLAHKTLGPVIPLPRSALALTAFSATTASYLVKPRARVKLLESFDQSVSMLGLGHPPNWAAIDIHWMTLQQQSLVFCVPQHHSAHQAPGYSDIQLREVDYYGVEDHREN